MWRRPATAPAFCEGLDGQSSVCPPLAYGQSPTLSGSVLLQIAVRYWITTSYPMCIICWLYRDKKKAIAFQKGKMQMAKIIQGERIGKLGKLVIGCSALIFDEKREKILLTRRSDNGRWCLPGGHMEAGESVAEAC